MGSWPLRDHAHPPKTTLQVGQEVSVGMGNQGCLLCGDMATQPQSVILAASVPAGSGAPDVLDVAAELSEVC